MNANLFAKSTSKFGTVSLDESLRLADGPLVQVTLGPRPVSDPASLLRSDVTYIAHHKTPLGSDEYLGIDTPDIAERLASLGIKHYSAHPPKGLSAMDVVDWALGHWQEFAKHGLTFAVETMYVGSRVAFTTPREVEAFLYEADDVGWDKPLVLDCAHLYINITQGAWALRDAFALAERGATREVHVSANDGVHDKHSELRPSSPATIWSIIHVIDRFAAEDPDAAPTYYIDEGRAR